MIICLGHLCHQGLTFIVKQIKESLRPPCGLCTQMCFTPSATLLKAFFALFLHLFMISNANLSNDFPCDVYTSVFNTQRNPAQSSFFSHTRLETVCSVCVCVSALSLLDFPSVCVCMYVYAYVCFVLC